MPDKKKLITDWIHCEITSDTLEIHRGRGDDKTWGGQKGKILEWSLPVLVEESADEILKQVYKLREWKPYGKGRETSQDNEELRDRIWQLVMPHIDIRSLRQIEKVIIKQDEQHFEDKRRVAMNRTQTKGTYVDENRIKKDKVIPSDECYTFVQSVEAVADWFRKNVNKDYFKNKVVYCNCDDTKSAFWIYFYNNFHKLGLKKLIASSFDKTGLSYGNNYEEHMYNVSLYTITEEAQRRSGIGNIEKFGGYIYTYDGKSDIQRTPPEGTPSTFHGDFKEKICYDIAKNEADIIITNPPFGKKWQQYVETMIETGKKIIFWGYGIAPTYNWFMPLLDRKKIFIVKDCSDTFLSNHFMTPTYHRKKVNCYIYTTEDLSFIKPDKIHYSTKKKMLKDGTAWYDENKILVCDKAVIPVDTDEILAVSIYIIRYGILNDGYEILKNYQRYAPIKGKKECFARILIQKKK